MSEQDKAGTIEKEKENMTTEAQSTRRWITSTEEMEAGKYYRLARIRLEVEEIEGWLQDAGDSWVIVHGGRAIVFSNGEEMLVPDDDADDATIRLTELDSYLTLDRDGSWHESLGAQVEDGDGSWLVAQEVTGVLDLGIEEMFGAYIEAVKEAEK